MAEIGLIASVIQVAGAGLKLSQTLYQYADAVASADRRIKDIAKEVQLTSFVITELGNLFKEDESSVLLTESARKTADETVRECSTVFDELDAALKKSRKNTLGRFMLPFRESKIELLRSHVDKLKSTLQLLMQVLTHAHQVASQRLNREAEAAQREQIKALLQTKKESTKRYEESLKKFRMSDHSTIADKDEGGKEFPGSRLMAASVASSITVDTLAVCVRRVQNLLSEIEKLREALSNREEGIDHSEHHQSLIGAYFRARRRLDSVLLGNKASSEDDTSDGSTSASEIAQLRQAVTNEEQNFNRRRSNSAQERIRERERQNRAALWSEEEEVSITRTLSGNTLHMTESRTSNEKAAQETALGRSAVLRVPTSTSFEVKKELKEVRKELPAHAHVESEGKLSNEGKAPSWTIRAEDKAMSKPAERLLLREYSYEPKEAEGAYKGTETRVIKSKAAEAEHQARAEKEALEAKLRYLKEAEEITKAIRTDEEVKKKEIEAEKAAEAEFEKRVQEEVARTTVEEQERFLALSQPPIKFKDAVGRKFNFPFHLCNTWEGMRTLINQAFQGVDTIEDYARQGWYDLLNADGETMSTLPVSWAATIYPGSEITMRLWHPPPRDEVSEPKARSQPASTLLPSDAHVTTAPPHIFKRKTQGSQAYTSTDIFSQNASLPRPPPAPVPEYLKPTSDLYSTALHRARSQGHSPAPNVTIYNSTQVAAERNSVNAEQRGRRQPSWDRTRVLTDELELEDEIEKLRIDIAAANRDRRSRLRSAIVYDRYCPTMPESYFEPWQLGPTDRANRSQAEVKRMKAKSDQDVIPSSDDEWGSWTTKKKEKQNVRGKKAKRKSKIEGNVEAVEKLRQSESHHGRAVHGPKVRPDANPAAPSHADVGTGYSYRSPVFPESLSYEPSHDGAVHPVIEFPETVHSGSASSGLPSRIAGHMTQAQRSEIVHFIADKNGWIWKAEDIRSTPVAFEREHNAAAPKDSFHEILSFNRSKQELPASPVMDDENLIVDIGRFSQAQANIASKREQRSSRSERDTNATVDDTRVRRKPTSRYFREHEAPKNPRSRDSRTYNGEKEFITPRRRHSRLSSASSHSQTDSSSQWDFIPSCTTKPQQGIVRRRRPSRAISPPLATSSTRPTQIHDDGKMSQARTRPALTRGRDPRASRVSALPPQATPRDDRRSEMAPAAPLDHLARCEVARDLQERTSKRTEELRQTLGWESSGQENEDSGNDGDGDGGADEEVDELLRQWTTILG